MTALDLEQQASCRKIERGSFYETVVRPLLFRLPAETAHRMGQLALKRDLPWQWLVSSTKVNDPRLVTRLGGLELANPIGLSAGLDKNALALRGLSHLGFGYLTVGSILPTYRPGNPKPRLIRYPDRESLLNCYGLPSDGRDRCVSRLQSFAKLDRRIPVVANIDAPSIDEYVRSFEAVEPHVAAIELGLQCPNNRGDEGEIHEPQNFERLLQEITRRSSKPLFVKMGLYADEVARANRMKLIELSIHYGLDAVVIPGIWKREEPALSLGIGATSGRMTFQRNLQVVRDIAEVARGRIAIKSNGGVFTGREAFQVLAAGASSIDVLAAFVYRGWEAPTRINLELLELMEEHRIPDVSYIGRAGSDHALA